MFKTILCIAIALTSLASLSAAQPIRLVVRADDMGVCHAGNEACITAYRQGIVRSVEVIVPGQWFPEAVKMVNDNPGLDVGVHLCLTSEWVLTRWRPLTASPSITDPDGFFYRTNKQNKDLPPNSGFIDAQPTVQDVQRELRAQIETARKHIKNLSHLSVHMGTATITPALKQMVDRLAQEYKLPVAIRDAHGAKGFGGPNTTPQQKVANLVRILEELQPGTWLMVEHPGQNTPEMQAMGHPGYWDVAADRQGVTETFTDPQVKQVISRRNIQLLSYAQANATP